MLTNSHFGMSLGHSMVLDLIWLYTILPISAAGGAHGTTPIARDMGRYLGPVT